MVLRAMLNLHDVKQKDTIVRVKTVVKSAMVIFPVLGLTWVFGLMTFNRETLFFRYLFAIFNSSQGMLIFLFHCIFNKQVKEGSLFMGIIGEHFGKIFQARDLLLEILLPFSMIKVMWNVDYVMWNVDYVMWNVHFTVHII